MPRRTNVNGPALIKAIESGQTAPELKERFGLKTSNQVYLHYIRALINEGKVAKIANGRSKPNVVVRKKVSVTKKGNVVLPKSLVESMGFKEGETFVARKTDTGFVLNKVARGLPRPQVKD